MKRNDIIAEYVETYYPHMLKTTDFVLFSTAVTCREFCKNIIESAKETLSILEIKQSDAPDQKQTEEKDNV